MSSGKILPYTEADRVTILKVYGRTPEAVKNDIENIKEWMTKQAHLPEVADNNLIERFLLLNKFRIEIAKQKLDMYYTARAILPELHAKDPSSDEMQKIMDVIYYITLPKLTKELYRVTIVKLRDTNPDNFDPLFFIMHTLNVVDVRLREDYNMSEVQIIDFSGTTLSHLTKFNPMLVRKCGLVVQKVLSNRITAIHFINTPVFAEAFLYLLRGVLSAKVMDRVHVHRDSASLHKLVQTEILPRELGGTEKSLHELNENWRKTLLEYDKTFQHLRTLTVNEKLRMGKSPTDDFFGTEGSFRKLELD